MLAMFDQPELHFVFCGLGLPDAEATHRQNAFGLDVDRGAKPHLQVLLYAARDNAPTPDDVRRWMDRVQGVCEVDLQEVAAADARRLHWNAQRCADLDRVLELVLLHAVTINSGGAVELRTARDWRGRNYAARFSVAGGKLWVGVPPVYDGHDNDPQDPEQAAWLQRQIDAAAVAATRDTPPYSSVWQLASIEAHNRLYRYLTASDHEA